MHAIPPPAIRALPDLASTSALAGAVARQLRPGDLVLLHGPLGAGKTEFARFLLRLLADDPALEVPSPSYTLVQCYETRLGPVSHFDLWRLDPAGNMADVLELGWDGAREGVVLVEWPDRLGMLATDDALHLHFTWGKDTARQVILSGWPNRLAGLIGAAA